MKSLLIAANWKMNKTPEEAMAFIKEFKPAFKPKDGRDILFCPSFLSLTVFKQEFNGTPIAYGAQNCHYQPSGAFTGEVSTSMLKSLGCTYCIVGHSERRTLFKETSEEVGKKVKALEDQDIIAIACVGETDLERSKGLALQVVEDQLQAIFHYHTPGKKIVIAYEPVWAIGTGKVATTQEIDEVHKHIRRKLEAKLGPAGQKVPILYGGSVNPQNSKEIESVGDVNGFLIGGAGLKVASLLEIY